MFCSCLYEKTTAVLAAPAPEAVVVAAAVPEASTGESGKGVQEDVSNIRLPVDAANKLLYDLDAQVKKLFDGTEAPVKEEKSGDDLADPQHGPSSSSSAVGSGAGADSLAHIYAAANRELDFHPRQSDGNAQGASLILQLENLEKRLLVSTPFWED